jgi:hypothetical protein
MRIAAAISLCVLMALTTSRVCSSREATTPQGAQDLSAFTGCYELELGHWWPWSFSDGEEHYVIPPSKIQLLATRGTDGFEHDKLLIRSLSEAPMLHVGHRRASFWQITSSDAIKLVWTDGFTGVSINLSRHGNGLEGWAHPHFDSPHFIRRISRVKAQPISCPL